MAAEHSTRGEETDNGRSTTWSEVALANPDIMKGVMEEFMETKVHIPLVVSMLTNIIIKIFFGLKVRSNLTQLIKALWTDNIIC